MCLGSNVVKSLVKYHTPTAPCKQTTYGVAETGSERDIKKIQKLLLFLDEGWFTLRRNINNQNNRHWCSEVPKKFRKVTEERLVCSECT
jgi:hypothetical protein